MWNFIKQINWAEVSKGKYDSETVKRTLMETFTEKTCKEIRAFVESRQGELYTRIEQYEKENDCRVGEYGGDDSFGDMISHVVGLGEDKFNEVMKDPSVLNGMAFVECFNYCLPYDGDYVLLSEDHHIDRAKLAIAALAEIVANDEPMGADSVRIVKDLMMRFMTILEGDSKAAVEDFDKRLYSRFCNFDGNDHHAMFANYLSDVKRFLV